MKASIIIPSYNARERLFLNLTALNNQDYNSEDAEVVVVDNGSCDHTHEMLQTFKLKFPLKVIRLEKNRGIARGRNEGILNASGDIIIFHDSDMIASRDFVTRHVEAHVNDDQVVCGLFWKRIYSYYYEHFSKAQRKHFEGFCLDKGLDHSGLYDGMPLLSVDQVNCEDLMRISFDLEIPFIKDLKDILNIYGKELTGYHLPWRVFITNNLSVKRKRVVSVGLLDEHIIQYGYEDYDLGIRLYKSGCRFTVNQDIVSLHQEHPANYTYKDVIENVNYICEKYNHIYFIDMQLVCLNEVLKADSVEINDIMGDVYRLIAVNSHHPLLHLFLELLQILRRRSSPSFEGIPYEVLQRIVRSIPEIIYQAKEVIKNHQGNHFVNMLCQLLKLVLNIEIEAFIRA